MPSVSVPSLSSRRKNNDPWTPFPTFRARRPACEIVHQRKKEGKEGEKKEERSCASFCPGDDFLSGNFWPDTMRNEPQKERHDDQRETAGCSDGYKFSSKSSWPVDATQVSRKIFVKDSISREEEHCCSCPLCMRFWLVCRWFISHSIESRVRLLC